MHSRDDAQYRLELAKGYLQQAEDAFADSQWWRCVSNAQLAIENAGKAIVACFEPVEKAHDTGPQLRDLLERMSLPPEVGQGIASLLAILPRYGVAEHIRSTYGDERTRTPPWHIYQESEARRALPDTQGAVNAAQQVFDYYFRQHPCTSASPPEAAEA